jgi:hypothetical protein
MLLDPLSREIAADFHPEIVEIKVGNDPIHFLFLLTPGGVERSDGARS